MKIIIEYSEEDHSNIVKFRDDEGNAVVPTGTALEIWQARYFIEREELIQTMEKVAQGLFEVLSPLWNKLSP